MATKAEMEAELKALKQDLQTARTKVEQAADAASDETVTAPATGSDTGDASQAEKESAKDAKNEGPLDWAMSQLDGSEIETLFKQFTAELEDMQAQKPLMSLFGAFVLGYVLGRAR